MAARQIWFYRRPDTAVHVQPAAVLRRQERGSAGLPLLRALSGSTAERKGEVFPAGGWRLSALRLDDRHDGKDDRGEARCSGSLFESAGRRLVSGHVSTGYHEHRPQHGPIPKEQLARY